jgi:hypothetical protein
MLADDQSEHPERPGPFAALLPPASPRERVTAVAVALVCLGAVTALFCAPMFQTGFSDFPYPWYAISAGGTLLWAASPVSKLIVATGKTRRRVSARWASLRDTPRS